MRPLILMLAIVVGLCVGSMSFAQCPGGVCPRPIRNAIAPRPTLAPRARTTVAAPHQHPRVERSVVVRRGHRSPGLLARIRIAPQRRW